MPVCATVLFETPAVAVAAEAPVETPQPATSRLAATALTVSQVERLRSKGENKDKGTKHPPRNDLK
jgi:hypothetical protein